MRMLSEMEGLSKRERLGRVGLYLLEYRRLRGDFPGVYKTIKEKIR